MRLNGCWAPLVTAVAALGVAGCGTSAPITKPTVNIAITAPTSGATVGVRDLTVTGTVSPATAQVLVGGQAATVHGGSFQRTLRLSGAAQTVTVTAQAAGYAPARAATRISYSAGLAAQLVAASRTLAAPTPSSAVSLTALAAPASASLLAQAVALPSAPSVPKPTAHRTNSATRSTPTVSTKTPSPTATPSPSPTSPSPSPAPVTTPAPVPVPPSPAAIAARVKQQWESNCLQKQAGTKQAPYCTCIYTHLEHSGAFKTPATVKLLVRRVNHYMRTGDTAHITRAILRALSTCQARFPASQTLGGGMTVTPLSSSHHRAAPPAPAPTLPAGPLPTPISPSIVIRF